MADEEEILAGNFKALNIIQSAFVAGLLIFSGVTYTLVKPEQCRFSWTDPLTIILSIVTLGGLGVGYFIFNQTIKENLAEDDLDKKLANYRIAFFRRSALLEGPALMSIIFVMTSNCYDYYLFTGICLMGFASGWITLTKMRSHLNF